MRDYWKNWRKRWKRMKEDKTRGEERRGGWGVHLMMMMTMIKMMMGISFLSCISLDLFSCCLLVWCCFCCLSSHSFCLPLNWIWVVFFSPLSHSHSHLGMSLRQTFSLSQLMVKNKIQVYFHIQQPVEEEFRSHVREVQSTFTSCLLLSFCVWDRLSRQLSLLLLFFFLHLLQAS